MTKTTASSDLRRPPGTARSRHPSPFLAAVGGPDVEDRREGGVAVEERRRTRRPERHKVVLHNDDYTTMEFVVDVLVRYFRKSPPEAMQVMLEVHHKGSGVAGVYPREVAETKVAEVTAEARDEGFPLLLTLEAE